MTEQLQQLRQLIHTITPVPDDDWQSFSAIWQPFTAKRKEIITALGEREKYLYFVTEGVQRVYYYDEQDREATLVFTYPPSFGGVLDAMLLGYPSRYIYEALTPSVFLRASYAAVDDLLNRYPAIATMIRMGITHATAGLLERMVEIQCYSSEEKFRSLLRRSPRLLQLVPHKYLANYLGIDATNFSKLINKIRI